jgi:hypothetical protein
MYERRVRMTPSPVGRCRQRGYLQEVPIVLAIVGVLLAVVVPQAPLWVGKVMVVVGALVATGCFYYMLLAPGWRPGKQLSKPMSWLGFVAISGAALGGAAWFVVMR